MMPLAFLSNMGPMEWIIILIICLLLFGHKLPSVARSLGSSVNEFKKGTKEGEEEAMKAQQAQPAAQNAAASQLKCGSCGALYVPGAPGAPCPNCKTAPPPVPQK